MNFLSCDNEDNKILVGFEIKSS